MRRQPRRQGLKPVIRWRWIERWSKRLAARTPHNAVVRVRLDVRQVHHIH
jgi:hypothetical protein